MSPTANELKSQASAAFNACQWNKSIELYSQLIQKDNDNYLIYSNRSAAYFKAGLYEKSLEDANKCISLEPRFANGYGRKGAALHAMKQFDRAVATYKEGLKLAPNDPHLEKGLVCAKRARVFRFSAAKAARFNDETVKLQRKQSFKAQQATTVSSFLLQTKKDLQLQMAAIQAKLDVIQELASLDPEGKADVLFTMMDKDGDGTINATELAVALQKGTSRTSFQVALQSAANAVADYDTNGDALLDIEEFGQFLNVTSRELELKYDEFAEYLAIQLLTSDDAVHRGKEFTNKHYSRSTSAKSVLTTSSTSHSSSTNISSTKAELAHHLNDDILVDLFKSFNKDGLFQSVSFRDVATNLYRLSRNLDKTRRVTIETILMMDGTDSRTLTFEQFARLSLAYKVVSKLTFDEMADELRFAMTIKDTLTEAEMKRLMVDESTYKAVKDVQAKHPNKTIDALIFARLLKLFDLWDDNHDGYISFNELSIHLKKFQASIGAKGDATLLAVSFFGFDTDGDRMLDRIEFTVAMINYAENRNVLTHDLIDFCSLSTVLSKEDAKIYQKAFKESLLGCARRESLKALNQQIYEAPEETDFS